MDVTRGQSLSGEYYSKSGNLVRLTLGNFDYHNNCFKDDKSKDNLYFTGFVKKEFILKKDDIITPLTEQAIGLLGSTAKIPCSGKYIQSQDVALIKCNKKLNPDFAFYLIPSKIVRNQLSAAAQQTKIRHTSPDKIKDCSVWVPEYSEQEKIGKLLSRIDEKISINRQINRNLEELAKQIYDYWFVQFDFPNEAGKPYKTSGGKMVWNETLKREVPDRWEVKLLKDIIEIKRGITITEKQTTSGTIKVVAAGVTYSYLHGESNRTPNCITVSGSGANAGFVNFWREPIFASDCSTIQFDNDIDTILCYHALKKQEKRFYQISHKSAQPHILPSDIGEIPMIIPSNSIKERISQFFIKTNKQIAEYTKELEHLSSLRDNLLPLLMNGQVTLNSCLSLIIHLYNTIFARFNFTTRNSK